MPLPTLEQVNASQELRHHVLGWEQTDQLLYEYFRNHPEVNAGGVVRVKVRLVNNFYNTKVRELALTQAIVGYPTLGADLENGNAAAVATIAHVVENRREASFASKFAHFHNPSKFPMWDARVQVAITLFGPEDAPLFHGWPWTNVAGPITADLYEHFRREMDALRNHFRQLNLNNSYKAVDEYLWLKGQQDLPDEDLSLEVLLAKQQAPDAWQAM